MAIRPPTRDERRAEARRLLDGLNGQWVARRMGMGDATISAWRRGDRVPDLGDLLALAIAVGRPLAAELDDRVIRLLEAGRVRVSPTPAVLDAARAEAEEVVQETRRRRRSPPRGDDGDTAEAGAEGHRAGA